MMPSTETTEYYSLKRLRWNTLVFTGGKGINAALNLSIFALIASSLSKTDFAIYAWLVAFVELSTNISRFGINWAVDRYVPQLRSTLNSIALRRFILVMTGLRVSVILLFAALFHWSGQTILSFSGKEDWFPAFDLYILVIVPYALMTFSRDIVFQSLLKQAHSQANTTIRHAIFLLVLFFFVSRSDELTLMNVIYGDIAATTVAATVALIQMGFLLHQLPYGSAPTSTALPTWRMIVKFAANSYANEVFRMSGSGYAVMTAAPQLLATAALAPYGFCQTLFTQLNRFLPAHLFSGLYRPRLVSEYTRTGSFGTLNRQLIVILKVSNYILASGIAVFFVYGGEILDLLSRGKYVDAHGLMMFFLVLMLVDNHRQVLMALCNTIERVDFLSRSSLFLPLVVPIAVILVLAGLGSFGLVAALIIAEVMCVGAIVYQLRRAGYHLMFDLSAQLRIAMAALVSILAGLIIHASLPDTWFWNIVGMGLTGLAFVAAGRFLRPMSERERASIERMVGRKVYVL